MGDLHDLSSWFSFFYRISSYEYVATSYSQVGWSSCVTLSNLPSIKFIFFEGKNSPCCVPSFSQSVTSLFQTVVSAKFGMQWTWCGVCGWQVLFKKYGD